MQSAGGRGRRPLSILHPNFWVESSSLSPPPATSSAKQRRFLSRAFQDAGITCIAARILPQLHSSLPALGSAQRTSVTASPKARKRHGKDTAKILQRRGSAWKTGQCQGHAGRVDAPKQSCRTTDWQPAAGDPAPDSGQLPQGKACTAGRWKASGGTRPPCRPKPPMAMAVHLKSPLQSQRQARDSHG